MTGKRDQRSTDIPVRESKTKRGLEKPRSLEGLSAVASAKEENSGEDRGMSSAAANIPSDWKWLPLGEFITVAQYGLSKKANPDTGVPLLRMTNQENGRITARDLKYVELDETEKAKFKVEVGDILFNRTNSFELVGRTAMFDLPGDFVFASYLIRLRTKPAKLLPEFLTLYFVADSTQRRLKSIATRAVSQSNISATRLKGFPIPLPPLPEQTQIAHILSTVQRAIAAQERIIQTTTELKKALMHKLFTEGLRLEPQKQTEIGPIPESWELQKLGDIANTISKGSSPKWQGFQYTESGILFVRSQNVGNGKMLLEDRAYLPASFNEKEKRSILKSGDILINLVGASIGRVALGTEEIEGGNCNQAVGFVRLKGSDSLKQLIVYFLLSPWGQEQMRRQKKDIARANLSLLDVRGFQIPIPSTDEEIEEAARALVTLEEKVATHERKRAQLQDLFRTLLHELMTAKTRVHEMELSTGGHAA